MENMHTDVGVERAEPLPFMFLKYQFIESVRIFSTFWEIWETIFGSMA